jgi:hypothetical protein
MKVPVIGMNVSTGALALGAIGLMVAPKVLPRVASFLKTATKTGIKGGMLAYDKSLELVSGTKESFQDMASEARSEISGGRKPATKKKAAAQT